MSLASLVEEIKQNKEFAEENITGGNPLTANSRLGRQNAAKARLQDLFIVYKNELRGKILSVLVTGPEADNFTKTAADVGHMYVASADNLYEDLAKRIDPVYYSGRESPAALVEVLSRHWFDKMGELDLRGELDIQYKTKYARKVSSFEELVPFVKEVMESEVGIDAIAYDVLDQITHSTFKNLFSGNLVPCVVQLKNGASKNEVAESLKKIGLVYTVTAGEGTPSEFNLDQINNKNVLGILKQINASVKKGDKKYV